MPGRPCASRRMTRRAGFLLEQVKAVLFELGPQLGRGLLQHAVEFRGADLESRRSSARTAAGRSSHAGRFQDPGSKPREACVHGRRGGCEGLCSRNGRLSIMAKSGNGANAELLSILERVESQDGFNSFDSHLG
ncbi:MAG: hypothetical protein MZV70_33180 [Desulfobacterales bacterium]|nr:hypothetical protein [Desulfobacterales bacterium]